MPTKRKDYPQKRTTDPALFEDDWDYAENYTHNEVYDEAVEVLRGGKRMGAKRI